MTAYDAETGEQAWRFYIVPGNPADGFENAAMEMAAKTWTGEWWKHGGGGNAWHGFTYDAELDTLYIGTGNGSPWNQKIRSPGGGDNLFLCSIVALDPDTGAYRWHYQTTPGETWDFNSNMDIVLADLTIGGHVVKALMHAPKNGFFYVIDRRNGKLLSAEPFAEVTWASKVDLATGRPVEVPGARYESGSAVVTPGPFGAHNWPPMSFNPRTGLVYIPTIHQTHVFHRQGREVGWLDIPTGRRPRPPREWVSTQPSSSAHRQARCRRGIRSQEAGVGSADDHRVESRHVDDRRQPRVPGTRGRCVRCLSRRNRQRALAVADGARHRGASDHLFHRGATVRCFAGRMGSRRPLWQRSPPCSAGRTKLHTRRLVAFSLEGNTPLPPLPPPHVPVPLEAPFFEVDAAKATTGKDLYGQCAFCHGPSAVSGGLAPDLRASAAVLTKEGFDAVLRSGSRRELGMPSYENLSEAATRGAEALHSTAGGTGSRPSAVKPRTYFVLAT